MKNNDELLKFIFELNLEIANREAKNQSVIAPGIPEVVTNYRQLISKDSGPMENPINLDG